MSFEKQITFKQLRALEAVSRTGSVTKAAAELFVTPPAISTQIKTLEILVGAKLLRRSGQGFQVNDCGQEVLQLGHRIQAAIETSSQKLQALQTGKAGSIGVGVVSTGKYFAPQILAAFMREYPDIDLRVTIGNRAEITQAL
ncbi:RuBisCO operon transcriptional regulator CbbR, partial [hydrothermal vent metagenome]